MTGVVAETLENHHKSKEHVVVKRGQPKQVKTTGGATKQRQKSTTGQPRRQLEKKVTVTHHKVKNDKGKPQPHPKTGIDMLYAFSFQLNAVKRHLHSRVVGALQAQAA